MRRAIVTLGLLMLLAIPVGVAAQNRFGLCIPDDPIPAGGCFVFIRDNAYTPDYTHVPVGTTVTWRNTGQQPHTVDEYGYRFNSGEIAPGGVYSVTFTEPGYYAYNCAIHPEMRGNVVVME
jgi:hypothetical protein